MRSSLSPSLIGFLGGIVVAMAGIGAYLQTSLGGPGTTAFVVRLLLVSLAVVGALVLGLALRRLGGGSDAVDSTSPARPDRDR